MCDIGKPLEVIDSQPVIFPAPLRKETEQTAEKPATVEAPAAAEPVSVTIERS